MNNISKALLVAAAATAVIAGLTSNSETANAATDGWLVANCVISNGVPRVELTWGSHPDANSNGLQKRDSHPSDPGWDWDWLPTTGNQRAYTDYNVGFNTTYWYRVKYRPNLPSSMDGVPVTCTQPTPTTPAPLPRTVSLSANPTSGVAPLFVSLTATLNNFPSCGNTYTWHYGDGSSASIAEDCFGNSYNVPSRTINGSHIYTQGTYNAYLTVSGVNSNTVYLYAYSVPVTPTPTPDPTLSLSTNPGSTWDPVGTTTLTWNSTNAWNCSAMAHPHTNQWTGSVNPNGTKFITGIAANTTFVIDCYGPFHVQRVAYFTMNQLSPTPSPTPTPTLTPTPTPTPVPPVSNGLEVRKLGKNITKGQDTEQTSVIVSANDTLEFVIRVRATGPTVLSNVIVNDAMPSGLEYISRSTSVNGILVADGVTNGGINIGSLNPGQEVVVKFNARVHSGSIFPSGTLSVFNVAQARSDRSPVKTSAQLAVTYSQVKGASIGKVAGVDTGVADTLVIALLCSFMITYGYIQYTNTPLFRRRDAVSVAKIQKGRMNFTRFL